MATRLAEQFDSNRVVLGFGPDYSHLTNTDEVMAKDMADGINGDVRFKESVLRQAAAQLQPAMAPTQVIAVLGRPDTAKRLVFHGTEHQWDGTPIPAESEEARNVCFGYWPRVGVPFDGRNGQGYQVLYVRFDAAGLVAKWEWTPPTIVRGSARSLRFPLPYWGGTQETSGPPPFEMPLELPSDLQLAGAR